MVPKDLLVTQLLAVLKPQPDHQGCQADLDPQVLMERWVRAGTLASRALEVQVRLVTLGPLGPPDPECRA